MSKRLQSGIENACAEKGRWAWHEGKGLVFERDARTPRRKTKPWTPAVLQPAPQKKVSPVSILKGGSQKELEDTRVTLDDVKAVAVGLISTSMLKKMHKRTAMLFDECYRSEQMNRFLWETLLYFDAFLENERAKSDENITIPGEPGKEARETFKKSKQALAQKQVNLGETYCFLILGMGNRSSHHTLQGELKISRTHTDQDFYETFYAFAMYVTWITFNYEHWQIIHEELGRLFRTPQFNRGIRAKDGAAECVVLEGLGATNTQSTEYLSYRVYYDRPPVGSLHELHSPAFANYLPSPKEKQSLEFKPPYKPTDYPEKVGIIGELMSKLDPETLKYVDASSDSESASDESDISDIVEDDGSDSENSVQ